MTFYRQGDFVRRDAAAIVGHFYQALPGPLDGDADLARPGIQRIFYQFFDY